MKTTKHGLKGQPQQRISTNGDTVTAFFQRMSLLQRIEPVLTELTWEIIHSDAASPRQRCLPNYCYNILRIFRKTYFKALPLSGLERCGSLDWECLGQMIGAGMSCLRFGESQLQDVLASEGLDNLSPEEMTQLVHLVFPSTQNGEGQPELWPQIPNATVQDMVANHFALSSTELWERFAICNQGACQYVLRTFFSSYFFQNWHRKGFEGMAGLVSSFAAK